MSCSKRCQSAPLAIAAVALALTAVSLLSGCSGSTCSVCSQVLTAAPDGSQEVPPVTTSATATATMVVDSEGPSMDVTITWQGLSDVTTVRINYGVVGQNGPYVLRLYDATTDGPFTNPYHTVVTEDDLQPRPELGLNECKDVCAAMSAGEAYLNISTQAYPDGEIRGQIKRIR